MPAIPAPTDVELVRASRSGEREAFGALVLRHSRVVRAICMARIGNEEVDDAVQEVFLRAYRGLARLNDDASFSAYLAQIARNHCVDRLRTSANRNRPLSLEAVALEPADPRAVVDEDHEALLARLRREIARLPESQREVLLLFYFERLSYARMAEMLGLTEAAVNQRLSRARHHLRETFAQLPEARP